MIRLGILLTLFLFATAASAASSYEETAKLLADKDYGTARAAAETLAAGGDARAMTLLGQIYQTGLGVVPDEKQAMLWYQAAAEKDEPAAQFALAMIYLNGTEGVANLARGREL